MKKRTGMKTKLQIKSKKDWLIALIFSFFLIYLVMLHFQGTINDFLMLLTPGKFSYFNQPEDEGLYAATVLAVSALTIGVMIYKRVKGKYLVLALVGGIAIAGVAMGSYYYQCCQILQVPLHSEPAEVTIFYGRGLLSDFDLSDKMDEKMKRQIAEKVLLMEPLSKEEQKDLERSDMEDGDKLSDETVVFISYSRKKGYSYHIIVSVRDDSICIQRGRTKRSDVFYRDNGLLEMIESIAES